MEYLLVASVTLLIGCCVAALVLEPPVQLDNRSSAHHKRGPVVRRIGHPRRSRGGRTGMAPSLPPSAPICPTTVLSPPAVSASREFVPVDCHAEPALDDAPPYSPQELRNLLDRRPLTSSQAS